MQFTEEHSYSHTCTRELACGRQWCLIESVPEIYSVWFRTSRTHWLWLKIVASFICYSDVSLKMGQHKMALNAPDYLQNVLLIRPWRPVHWEGGQSIVASSCWMKIKPPSYSCCRLGLSWNKKKEGKVRGACVWLQSTTRGQLQRFVLKPWNCPSLVAVSQLNTNTRALLTNLWWAWLK